MRDLRTATYAYVTLGPFIGSSDGFTIKNSLGSTAELVSLVIDSDTGGLPTLAMDSVAGTTNGANDFAIVAGCDAGFYSVELTTANTAYIGRGHIAVINSTHCPVFEPVRLWPQDVYDSLFCGSSAGRDYLQVDTRQVGGTTQTARDLGASVLLSSGTAAGQVNLSSGSPYVLLTSGAGIGAVILSTGYLSADIVKIAGTTVNSTIAQLGCNAVQIGATTQTGRDIGASVLLSSGTGAGQVLLSTGYAYVLLSSGTGAGQVNLSSGLPYVLLSSGTGVGQVSLSSGYALAQLTTAPADSAGVTELLTRIADAPAGSAPTLALTAGTITADAGNTASSFRTSLTDANDYWIDALILITSGALAGQIKEIGGFANTNGVITLTAGQAFTGIPAGTVSFSIVNR
jgi:hypothetical protein